MSESDSFFDEAEEIFRQLANSHRLQIMSSLHTRNGKMSTISKEMKARMQDVKRNLDNLLNEGLVERDSHGVFSLTTFGRYDSQTDSIDGFSLKEQGVLF